MDKGVSPKDASKEISESASKEIVKLLKKVKIENPSISTKIFGSISILIVLSFVQNFMFGFLTGFSNPLLSMYICTIIIAPIFEEYSKRLAIKKKYPFVYTGIFGGLEFIMYVVRIVLSGASLPKTIIMRSISLLMHFSTTLIQKIIIDKYGLESFAGRISWIIAVGIHSMFNILGTVYNREIHNLIL